MDANEVKRIIDEYLNEHAVELKARLFNLDGYKSDREFKAQENRIAELERQLEELQQSSTLDDLTQKVAELDKVNLDLTDKLDETTNQYNDAKEKVERYRTETKKNLQEIEELKEALEERERQIESLEAKLKETEEHFRSAAAESVKYRNQLEAGATKKSARTKK